jgi:tRNA threonylcarbamoyladenosine biosynthesis protein TsaB
MHSVIFPSGTQRFLALDTSTDVLSLGLGESPGLPVSDAPQPPTQTWVHTGAGGSQSSATLIPEVLRLLQQAGQSLQQLDAIVVGIGPGSFTGLRTACAVAQGLALGANLPVLPVSTLLAVAEDWRHHQAAHYQQGRVWALLDARMGEIYAACWQWQTDDGGCVHWHSVHAPVLVAPENLLALPGLDEKADILAGNAQGVYGPRLPLPVAVAGPTAAALLRLAPTLLRQGLAVDAALVLPHYVRDKVAQTTAERAGVRAAGCQTA